MSADQIDATNLQVAAANVTGQLSASQIDVASIKIENANIDGQLDATKINTTNMTIGNKTTNGTSVNISNGHISLVPPKLVNPDDTSVTYVPLLEFQMNGNSYWLVAYNSGGSYLYLEIINAKQYEW